MQKILKRQDEPEMLKVQFVAKFYFNAAERSNKLAAYLALVSLLCLVPYPDSWFWVMATLFAVIDVLVLVLTVLTRRFVNNAADLRAYFDSYVLSIKYDFNYKLDNRLKGLIYRVVRRYPEQAKTAMENTGWDTPPGVKSWYGLKSASSHNEAVVKCLNENRWWDEKLNMHRVVSSAFFLTIVVLSAILLVFVIEINWVSVMLAMVQLIVRFGERIEANVKYYNATERLKGAYSLLDESQTKANQRGVQKAIDARRHIPVLGSNKWHQKRARKLSEEYEDTIS